MRLAALLVAVWASAQTISYVVSVKPNNSLDARGRSEYSPGGRFTATAITAQNLMRLAYRLQDYQFAGTLSWFSTKRYDIVAKADSGAPTEQLLLQTLLRDRFHLAVHNETRELASLRPGTRKKRWPARYAAAQVRF